MSQDQIADMIVRIKNASDAKKESVVFPYSKFKAAILDTLAKEKFIHGFNKKGKKAVKFIEVMLSYEEGAPRISGVSRISKTSKRVYQKSANIRKVKSGMGSLILSTPKGIMTDVQARKENVGGEALFTIW